MDGPNRHSAPLPRPEGPTGPGGGDRRSGGRHCDRGRWFARRRAFARGDDKIRSWDLGHQHLVGSYL